MINPTDTIFAGLFKRQGDGFVTVYSVHANEKAMKDFYADWETANKDPIWLPNDYSMEELEEQDMQDDDERSDDCILIEDALPVMVLADSRTDRPQDDNSPYHGMVLGYELTCEQLNRIIEEQEA